MRHGASVPLALCAIACGAALNVACDPVPVRATEIIHETGTIEYVAAATHGADSPRGAGSTGSASSEDPEKPRIRYAGGQESQNDRCVVRKAKLNLRMQPTWVNGRPIGFC